MTDPTPAWTLTLKEWRGLEHVSWSPYGVSLLSGPNGSGKTSLLEALSFLRSAWLRGVSEALRFGRGPSHLRRLGAKDSAPIHVSLQVGELYWEILLGVEGSGIHSYHGELLRRGDEVLLRKALFSNEWSLGAEQRPHDARCCLRVLWDMQARDDLKPLVELLGGIRSYDVYALNLVRRGGDASDEADLYLHPTGRNLLWVLRNWKTAARRFNGQFAWVLEHLKRAFPDQIEDLEFDTLGQAIQGRFYPARAPSPDDSLPVHLAADGLLTGLLHLTAVAGARPGSIVAFDEMENQLHPHAIRSILGSMRERAEEQGLTILLTTHSPVLMNAFKGYEEQFFVLERGTEPSPTPLHELKDPDWLAHFALGDLYERLDFAAPQTGGA